jgi:hypothetical protein
VRWAHGRAVIDPDAPEATALCDRCKKLYNRGDLHYQFDWVGRNFQSKRLLVCDTCYDEPSEYLRTLTIPADPMPVIDGRVLGTPIDFQSNYTLSKPAGTPSMFPSVSAADVSLFQVYQPLPALAVMSAFGAAPVFGALIPATATGASGFSSGATFGALISPSASSVGELSATLAATRGGGALLGGAPLGEDALGGGASITV